MEGSRFNEEQIIGILREAEAGERRQRYVAGTASRTRPSTSMDGSPIITRPSKTPPENSSPQSRHAGTSLTRR